jgi:hypothetical protein
MPDITRKKHKTSIDLETEELTGLRAEREPPYASPSGNDQHMDGGRDLDRVAKKLSVRQRLWVIVGLTAILWVLIGWLVSLFV